MEPMTSRVDSGSTRGERLDRLPFTREHTRLVVGSGLGWALDAMDVGLISFVMAALAVQWELGTTTLSAIASIGFIGMAIGASLGGLLADRIGRRQVFAATLLVYGLATGAAALSWSVGALLFFRFVIGLGLGAELPVAATLVSEFAPARIRGRVVVALEAFWSVGWLLAALIGYFVVSASDDGWRWALAVGAVPALYAAFIRFGCLCTQPCHAHRPRRPERTFDRHRNHDRPTSQVDTQAAQVPDSQWHRGRPTSCGGEARTTTSRVLTAVREPRTEIFKVPDRRTAVTKVPTGTGITDLTHRS